MEKLKELLFGKKYYIVVLYDMVYHSLSSTIFGSMDEAKEFKQKCLMRTQSFTDASVLTIRTKKNIVLMPKK